MFSVGLGIGLLSSIVLWHFCGEPSIFTVAMFCIGTALAIILEFLPILWRGNKGEGS